MAVVNINGHHYLDPHGGGGGSPRQGVPGAVGHDDAGDGGHFCVCVGCLDLTTTRDRRSEQEATEQIDNQTKSEMISGSTEILMWSKIDRYY